MDSRSPQPVAPDQSSRDDAERSKKKKKIFIISILSLLVVATVCFIVLIPIFSVKAIDDALIKIPRNATPQTVRDSVAKYLGEEYADQTMKVANLQGADFSKRHGAYLIPKGMSPAKAARLLISGAQHPLKLVINGFRTKERLAEKVSAKLDFSSDSLLKTLADPEILKKYGVTEDEVMALFPDATYEIYWTASPEQVIEKTADAYKYIWNDKRKEKAAALGLTPIQTMILCSIIDEESNKADDKGRIGRLYINRLQKGMKLQADPTVRFAIGDFTIKRVLNKHLTFKSPYNTYLVEGLPPGPIRTTGTPTIDSILNSQPHNYLYMCAKADFSGYHAFAETYDEHLKNARLYQQALNEKGIK